MRLISLGAILVTAAAIVGCGGSPELEAAYKRGQEDCFGISQSAREYEECVGILEAWLDNPEENPPPSFVE